MRPAPSDITLVIADLGPGGAQRVVSNLLQGWVGRGRDITLVTFTGPECDFFHPPPGTRRTVVSVPARHGRLRGNLRRVAGLRKAIRDSGSPVVVSFIGATNVLAVLATAGLDVRMIISERNDPSRQRLPPPWERLRQLTYRFADTVTANSAAALSAMEEFVPAAQLAFVPNPIVLPDQIETRRSGTRTILCVASFTEQKAHDVLLAAFARIAPECLGWRLVLVGEGPLEKALRGQARELGIADRIDWIGRTRDPFRYYAEAEIFALPSRYEGTPNALMEAMAMGVAPIVTDTAGGASELVDHGVTGIVVPVDAIDPLADALAMLVQCIDDRESLGAAARRRMEPHALDAVITEWDRVLGLT